MELKESQAMEECVTTPNSIETVVSNEEVISRPSEHITNSGERSAVVERNDLVRDKPLTFDGRIIWLQAEPIEFETIECDQEVEITTSESYCALEDVIANGVGITEACNVFKDMPTVEITSDPNNFGLQQIVEVKTDEIVINNKVDEPEVYSDEDLEDALEEINCNNPEIADPSIDSNGMFTCISCQLKYRTSRDIWEHARESAVVTRWRTEPAWKKYICCRCGYTTDRIWSLKTHVISVHKHRKPYMCPHCQYSCTEVFDLRSHLRLMHRKERPYVCHECHFRSPASEALKRHILLRHKSKKTYQCQFCDFTTKSSAALKTHVGYTHTKEKPHQCKMCDFKVSDFDLFKSHLLLAHGADKSEKLIQANSCKAPGPHEYSKIDPRTKSIKERVVKQFTCTYCSFSTTKSSSLDMHITAKHTEIKGISEPMVSYSLSCSFCDYKTNKNDNLKKHIEARHAAQTEQECPFCGFRAGTFGGLKRHTKAVHLKKKYYVCSYCNFSASLPTDLENHVYECHQNEKKEHRCHQCMFSSDTSSELTNHIVSEHLKPSRGLCPFCELRDDDANRLALHIRTEHAKQKMYRCPHCDFSCTTEKEIQSHNTNVHNL